MRKLLVVAFVVGCATDHARQAPADRASTSTEPNRSGPTPPVGAGGAPPPPGGSAGSASGGSGSAALAREHGVLGSTTSAHGSAFVVDGHISSGFGEDKGGGTGGGAVGGMGDGAVRGTIGAGPKTEGRANATAKLGAAKVSGALDKAIVRRYMVRHRDRITACYEQQLAVTPGVGGALVANFTIGGDGKVTSSSASGVHAAVETCVADAIRQIEFPKPADGKPVTVTYPFTLAPAPRP